LRGHIFTTEKEDLAVITIKGTTARFMGIGGDTATKDKLNVGFFVTSSPS
jgi:putative lipase involved disintegration of autophagic bodies